MPLLRLVNSYPTLTGLSKDTQTNTLHFQSAASQATMTTLIDVEWANFLLAIDTYMSSQVFATPATWEYFDIEDAEPRVPVDSASQALTLTASTSLPQEVSMVVSYGATPVSGINQARRRGRIYLPTFTTGTIVSASGRTTWSPSVITAVGTAFRTMVNNLRAAATPVYPVVFSPTIYSEQGGISNGGNFAYFNITQMWIDNEPDTQRRRGGDGGTKTAFTIT